jgi:glutamate-ammonia-ligase adenylyltransferase
VENRLRLVHGYSLARLPTSGRPLAVLARRLGYVGTNAGASFLAEYREHSLNVHLAYGRILRKAG